MSAVGAVTTAAVTAASRLRSHPLEITPAADNLLVSSTCMNGCYALACCSCRDARRRVLVVIYFAIIIAFITLFGVLTIPDIVREGADFIKRLKSDNVWVILVEKMRHGLG
jgi:hypothetical protein